jgi:hypothetical protein
MGKTGMGSPKHLKVHEMRTYRINTDLCVSLLVMAEQRVGVINRGPRHIVDLRSEALRDQLSPPRGPAGRALTDEVRRLPIKLLIDRAASYCRFAVGK